MRAFCSASGHIGFATTRPDGAILIAIGPPSRLRSFIEPLARLAYDGKTLLVPGVPEAPSRAQREKALQAWLDRLARRAPREVKVF